MCNVYVCLGNYRLCLMTAAPARLSIYVHMVNHHWRYQWYILYFFSPWIMWICLWVLALNQMFAFSCIYIGTFSLIFDSKFYLCLLLYSYLYLYWSMCTQWSEPLYLLHLYTCTCICLYLYVYCCLCMCIYLDLYLYLYLYWGMCTHWSEPLYLLHRASAVIHHTHPARHHGHSHLRHHHHRHQNHHHHHYNYYVISTSVCVILIHGCFCCPHGSPSVKITS